MGLIMSMQVIEARSRLKMAREKHAVAKQTLQQTKAIKADLILYFVGLSFPMETAERLYQGCENEANLALADSLVELIAADEELKLIDPRPDSYDS